jgi:hypothetical protein
MARPTGLEPVTSALRGQHEAAGESPANTAAWRCVWGVLKYSGTFPAALLAEHEDRYALLDKPVLLHIMWDDGDTMACVQILPADNRPRDPHEKFEEIWLPFPAAANAERPQ